MPVRKVKGGYQWGSGHGKFATKEEAEAQGRAAYANGYKGDCGAGAREIADAIKAFEPKPRP
jgi:hypothetical protein